MKKGWKITISIIASTLLLIILSISIYFIWPWNRDFFDNAVAEFEIPGLDSEFVPQGITKIDGQNKFLLSGYMSNGSPSRFYVINSDSNQVEKYFVLETSQGKKYNEHAGGVASFGSTLWTVSSNEQGGFIYRFMLADVDNVENGEIVSIVDYVSANNNADWVFVHDNKLFVGEYYLDGKYETDSRHHFKNSVGKTYGALALGYTINESKKCGLQDLLPEVALSVDEKCQGIAVTTDGNFITSSSYSVFKNSNINMYNNVLLEESTTKFKFTTGCEIPVYFLDDSNLISSKQVPIMSEEIVVDEGKLFILFESSAKKYKKFCRVKLEDVYSVTIDYLAK